VPDSAKKPRGFAAMDREKQRAIARTGGKTRVVDAQSLMAVLAQESRR